MRGTVPTKTGRILGIPFCYSGLQIQGTATSPPIIAKVLSSHYYGREVVRGGVAGRKIRARALWAGSACVFRCATCKQPPKRREWDSNPRYCTTAHMISNHASSTRLLHLSVISKKVDLGLSALMFLWRWGSRPSPPIVKFRRTCPTEPIKIFFIDGADGI